MMLIETESGSRYVIDPANLKMKRMVGEYSADLDNDETWMSYIKIHRMELDAPMTIEWSLQGVRKMRETTPVIAIGEVNG